MTDKELLELAAKAAGIKGGFEQDPAYKWQERQNWVIPYNNNGLMSGIVWNPLTDDGDALRLAVTLKLNIESYIGEVVVADAACNVFVEKYENALNYNDSYAATRRAIVCAAAEIGKVMK